MSYTNNPTIVKIENPNVTSLAEQLAENVTQKQESANFGINKNTYPLKPLVTFIDDDGFLSTLNQFAPLFDAKGVKFVSAVTSGKVGVAGYMTKEQVMSLQNNGHEIASHGVTHSWLSQNLDEIGNSYTALRNMGFNVENLVYPGGDFSVEAIREAKKYYDCATVVAASGGVNTAPIRSYALPRVTIAPVTPRIENGINVDGTLASYKAMVDYTIANNGWLIWMVHSNGAEYTAEQHQNVSDLIDYIKSKSVSIVTLKEGMKTYGNKIDVGDPLYDHFLVGANGKIKSNDLDKRITHLFVENDTTITGTTPYNAFPKGKVHTAIFTSGKAVGFPHDAGTLITHYLNYEWASFQYWHSSPSTNKVYYRKWNGGTSSWGAWGLLDYSQVTTTYQENIEITGSTVTANSYATFDLTMTQAANFNPNSDTVVASPRAGIEPGIIWSVVMSTDKTIRLRAYNTTASNVFLATRTWHIKVIK
jgi:peptidoglycan/xylan/chitin deacetylase (PgdA/CDA1 family)